MATNNASGHRSSGAAGPVGACGRSREDQRHALRAQSSASAVQRQPGSGCFSIQGLGQQAAFMQRVGHAEPCLPASEMRPFFLFHMWPAHAMVRLTS